MGIDILLILTPLRPFSFAATPPAAAAPPGRVVVVCVYVPGAVVAEVLA